MLDKKTFDWINLILGFWVFISPWLLGFAAATGALWTAIILGLVVMAVSAWALYRPEQRAPEWVNVVLGVLLFIAPWVIGFTATAAAAWNSWLLGIVIAAIAAWTFLPHTHTPQPTH